MPKSHLLILFRMTTTSLKSFTKHENTESFSTSGKIDDVPQKSVNPFEQNPKPHPDMQDQPLNHNDIEKRFKYLEELAKQQKNQFDEDILLNSASSSPEPMVKLRVDSETIDISKAGSWYDGGELISILKRR